MLREIEKKLRQQVHPSVEVSNEMLVTQSALLTHHRNLGISKAKKNIKFVKYKNDCYILYVCKIAYKL